MYFINKDDVEFYRYAVAKDCFLRSYSYYELIEDIPKSNCMRMRKGEAKKDDAKKDDTKEDVVVSLFKIPTIEVTKDEIVECYYQSRNYKNALKKYEGVYRIVLFDCKFDELYNQSFKNAIKSPRSYIEERKDKDFLFETILIKHKDSYGFDKKCYKYYSQEKVDGNKYNVVDGVIYFSDPNTFNDPFDVNCFFKNSKDMSKLFRIFCAAPTQSEILMWSYYSSEHKGYCFQYNMQDILNEILAMKIDGICVIGEVEYTKKRPKQRSKLNAISITEINFYIQAAFSKFEEWKHEKEFRFVLLSDSFESEPQYIPMNIPVYEVYSGLENSSTHVSDMKGNSIPTKKMKKDTMDYKLVW